MALPTAKLVVVKPGALGDTLLLAPALRALREVRPAIAITVVGSMPAVRLLKRCGVADAVHDIDRLNFFAPAEAEYDLLNGARVLACMPLDRAGCKSLSTVVEARSVVSWASRDRPPGQHMAVYLHQGLRRCYPQTGALSRAAFVCPDVTFGPGDEPYAVLAPGAGRAAKRAPMHVFKALAQDMAARGVTPVFLAGQVEIEQRLVERYPERYSRIDNPSLEDLAGLLKAAAVVYANDSGPAHLAGLLGTSTTVFFGPTDPAVWQPWGPAVEVRRFPYP